MSIFCVSSFGEEPCAGADSGEESDAQAVVGAASAAAGKGTEAGGVTDDDDSDTAGIEVDAGIDKDESLSLK